MARLIPLPPCSRSTFFFSYDQAAHWNDVQWYSILTITLITGAKFSYPVSGVTQVGRFSLC